MGNDIATDDHDWDFPDDLLEAAWGIIANASDWDDQPEWRKAASRWRDAYHETLRPADVIEKRLVETFLNSLTEIEAGPDDWPEYAALLEALGEYTE